MGIKTIYEWEVLQGFQRTGKITEQENFYSLASAILLTLVFSERKLRWILSAIWNFVWGWEFLKTPQKKSFYWITFFHIIFFYFLLECSCFFENFSWAIFFFQERSLEIFFFSWEFFCNGIFTFRKFSLHFLFPQFFPFLMLS